MIKAIFFDIDGTLISHTLKDIPPNTKKALSLLKEKNIQIFIATGRHLLEMQELPTAALSFDGYITLNGQLCLDAEKNLLMSTPIAPKDCQTLLSLFEKKELPLLIVEEDRMYLNFINEYVRQAQADISSPIPEIGSYTGNPIYQFIAYADEPQAKEISSLLSESRISRWNKNAIDIIPSESGKAAKIHQLLKKLQLSSSEIMAFGDSENDREMLQYAKIGVAMGNADDETKKYADHITDSVEEDGIYHALQFFKLL